MRATLKTAVLFGMLLAAAAAFPQEKSQPSKTPEEYEKEEFSSFLQALRRGEIILFGSFPITLFVTFEAYDLGRFFTHDRRMEYAPWPFRPPNAAPYSKQETINVLVTAVSISLALAVADYLIGRIVAKRAARRSIQGR
jgi:hypothetical protein